MQQPVCVADYERLAEERVAPDVWCYFAGGAEDEVTLRANRGAFSRWQFRPRMLVDVAAVSTETEVLGTTVSMPVLVAPTALHGLLTPDGELAAARAAAGAGTLMCVSTITTRRHDEIADAAPEAPRWQQVYILTDRGRTEEHLDEAAGCGYSAVVLTIDTPFWGRRERDLRLGFRIPPDVPLPYASNDESARAGGIAYVPVSASVSWRDVEWLAGRSGLPVVVKGLLTAEDALLAVEHGAAAIVVSNHGGRQLDSVAASLDALPEVVDCGGRPGAGADGRRRAPRHRRAEGGRARRPRGARRQADPLRARRGRRGRRPRRARAPAGGDPARARPARLHAPGRPDDRPRPAGRPL